MFTKLVRIGRDAEMKYLSTGTAVLEMSAVYDIGFGENKKSQWIKISMFGARAEKLASHFTKGKQIVATMDDVRSEAWISGGEAKSGISAKLVEFEFAGGGNQQQATQGGQQHAPQQHAPQQRAPQMAPVYQQPPIPQHQATQQAPAQYNAPSMDFDDKIPF